MTKAARGGFQSALPEEDHELIAEPGLLPTQQRLHPTESVSSVLDATEAADLQCRAQQPQCAHCGKVDRPADRLERRWRQSTDLLVPVVTVPWSLIECE